MKKFVALLAVSMLGLAACSTEKAHTLPAPGVYETNRTDVNSAGTKTTTRTTTNVTQDANGNRSASTSTKTSNDPKGLFNKSTTSSTRTVQE